MASLHKRGKKYSVVFYNEVNGERKQIWESGMTYSQAKARKAAIEFEEAQGIKNHTGEPESPLNTKPKEVVAEVIKPLKKHITESANTERMLEPFMNEFIEVYGTKKWGTSYFNSGVNLLNNYVYEYWEGVPIQDFTIKSIDDYYTWLISQCKAVTHKHKPNQTSRYVTPSVVNDIHKILRCAFGQAKKWQYIPSNPFEDVTVPEYKAKERPALTPTEIEKVLDYTDNPNDYDLFLIHCAMNLAFAGSMRGGEVAALQWEDIVDEQRRVLYIHKAIDRVNKKALEKASKTKVFFRFPNYTPRAKSVVVLKNTKEDGGSDRNCYLPQVVYEKLMRLKEMQKDIKEELGSDYFDYGLIICQESGRPLMTEHLNRKFQEVLAKMGIKPKQGDEQYVFHSIRSTATTYKLRVSGGDIKAVQGENGQKDPKMVTHQYSRILDEDRIRIAETMNDDFYRKSERKTEESEMLSAMQKNSELFKQFMAFMEVTKSANY